jgi:hypothetical protein
MRKNTLIALAAALTLLPIGWTIFLLTRYDCELGVYSREWQAGSRPGWLALWIVLVSSAGLGIAGILIPKVIRWRRLGTPLTRGEWSSLVIVAALIGVIASISPKALRSPATEFTEFQGHRIICPH